MPDLNAVEQVGRPAGWHQLKDGVFWNAAGPVPSCSSDQNALHGVARRLVGGAGNPADRRLVETLTHPPFRLASGRMHGGLHATSKRFSRLVGCHEEYLSMTSARVVKVQLLRIRSIVRQCVLDRTLGLDRIQPS